MGERVQHAPAPDMRPEADDQEHLLPRSRAERPQRPAVRPFPVFQIGLRIAEDPRRAGRAGGRKYGPAAVVPDFVVMGGVGAPGRMGRHIGDHLFLVDRLPFRQVVDSPDIVRRHPRRLEPALVERAVLVEKRRELLQLGVLDRADFVARRGFKTRRPVFGGRRLGEVAAIVFENRHIIAAGRRRTVFGHGSNGLGKIGRRLGESSRCAQFSVIPPGCRAHEPGGQSSAMAAAILRWNAWSAGSLRP